MSIDMYLDRSRNQASSVGNLSQSMNSNYDALEKQLLNLSMMMHLKVKHIRQLSNFQYGANSIINKYENIE